jgi:hypothetical protein
MAGSKFFRQMSACGLSRIIFAALVWTLFRSVIEWQPSFCLRGTADRASPSQFAKFNENII